jgi:hypothetical protein
VENEAMVMTKHRFARFITLGLYALVLGFLGMAAERMRVDARREAVLRQYDDALQRWHSVLMEFEKEPDARSFSNSSSRVSLGRHVDVASK